jgi:carbon storage regulator
MLVLTRKPSERITIGRDVEVVVLRISGNRVRLGISAPNGVAIVRDDISGARSETADGTAEFRRHIEVESCAVT